MATETGKPVQAETGHAESAFPPFNAETFPSQLLWFAIVFGLLYYLMSRIALPRVGSIFQIRKARIDGDLEEASRLNNEAEEAHANYEKTLAQAKSHAHEVAHAMRDRLAAEDAARRKSLEEGLNAKLAQAEKQISETRQQAMANVEAIAVDAAGAIVQVLTGRAGDPDAIRRAAANLHQA